MEINGSGLKQLTGGPYTDIEPTYLPDGGISPPVSASLIELPGIWKREESVVQSGVRCG